MTNTINFANGNLEVKVNLDNGQLISLKMNDFEYFHNGGENSYSGRGWKNSEIIPFPIFGPPIDQQAEVKGEIFFLEQHGISRYLDWELLKSKKDMITLIQKYDSKKIPNPKYSTNNEHPKYLTWIPFTLEKTFELKDRTLVCTLKLINNSNSDMPYMLGWHPAFDMLGEAEDGKFFKDDGKSIADMKKVVLESNSPPVTALVKEGINAITYKNSGKEIRVSSEDFDNIMIWSPNINSGMFCIEHLSKIPIHDGSKHFDNIEEFELLKSNESKTYSINIELLKN